MMNKQKYIKSTILLFPANLKFRILQLPSLTYEVQVLIDKNKEVHPLLLHAVIQFIQLSFEDILNLLEKEEWPEVLGILPNLNPPKQENTNVIFN